MLHLQKPVDKEEEEGDPNSECKKSSCSGAFLGSQGIFFSLLVFVCLFVCWCLFVCFLLDHLFAQMCDLKLHGSLMYCSTRENCLMSETL